MDRTVATSLSAVFFLRVGRSAHEEERLTSPLQTNGKVHRIIARQRAGAVAEEEDTGAAAHSADAEIKPIVLLCGTGAVVRLEAA